MLAPVLRAAFRRSAHLFFGCSLAIMLGIQADGDPLYSVTQITGMQPGKLPLFQYSAASALNDLGEVVGYASNGPVVWKNGTVTPLGTLGGDRGVAYGINNSGQVVGQASTASGALHAFLYSNGTMTDLGTFGGSQSIAYGISDSGQVVGYGTTSSGDQHAFLHSSGSMIDLGTLGGHNSVAIAINRSGQIAGYSTTTPQLGETPLAAHAFLYSNGRMTDLGTLPGQTFSAPVDINNAGQIVGQSSNQSGPFGPGHSFLYGNGTMVSFGSLPGVNLQRDAATAAIDDRGQVVGWWFTLDVHAFLYSNGTMTDLNSFIDPSLQITLSHAYAINDVGQILVGDNNFSNENYYLLTPTPVPEPAALLLCAGAVIAFAGFRRFGARQEAGGKRV